MEQERKYWEPEIETMPLDKLRKLQEERLQEIVAYAYEKTKFYRRKYDQAGVKPSDVNTLDDLGKLPLVEDTELRNTPMEDKLAVPWEDIKYCCSSSGTTGVPEPLGLTREDFEIGCVSNLSQARWAMGVRPSDVVQHMVGLPCQLMVTRNIGATICGENAGRGNFDNQIIMGYMLHATVLEQMPSMVLRYFERAKELGIDMKESKIRLIVAYGEGWAESYKRKVERDYGVVFHSFYGFSQAGELAYECEVGGGMHIVADSCIIEIINPQTKQALEPGEEGELVVTNFFRKAMPRIRVRSSDITRILPYQPCPCGRTHPKISMIHGRLARRINVKGKMLYPVDVEEVLGAISDLGYEYQIILEKPGEQERLKVKTEYRPEVTNLAVLKTRVEEELSRALGVDSEVELVPTGSIGRAMFKAQRIITAQ